MRAPSAAWLLVLAIVVAGVPAHARGNNSWFQLSLDGSATWLATVPTLPITSNTSVTFNALRGARIPSSSAEPSLFAGGGLDTRTGPLRGDWFMPLFGFRFAAWSFTPTLALGDNVTASFDTLLYSEILLPGIGVRLDDHFTVAARLAYVRLDLDGTATDGHLSLDINAGQDGIGILGEATACVGPHSSVCLFAEPAVLYLGGPDFALTFGARVVFDPTR